eukprot:TRINITY_DN69046_c0_g1_i1.p1 TRINITY_DN69046_c0_g1~~TRINITY_DN69046_c0_g1_i1.p1  ORF type:complete len:235 (-),score=40.64 TRINITY_DN69046_c0_g1_i1:162-866(-)
MQNSEDQNKGRHKAPPLQQPPSEPVNLETSEGLEALRKAFMEKSVEDVLTRKQFCEVVDSVVGGGAEGSANDGPQAEKVLQLNTIFDTFDKDRNGSVDIDEFTSGMRILFNGTEDEKMEFAFSGLDYNHDGDISVKEFLQYFKHYFTAKSALYGTKLEGNRWATIQKHLQRVFRGTDADRSGTIDMMEFRDAVKKDPDHPFGLVWQSFDRVKSPNHSASPGGGARGGGSGSFYM